MKNWDPKWRDLKPVEPVRRDGPPPAPIEGLELRRMAHRNLRDYERNHLKHVLEKEAERHADE